MYWLGYIAVLFTGLALATGLIYLGRQTQRPKLREMLFNLTLSGLFIFLTLMALEFYFKVFFAQSDAYVFTLSAQNWEERYWQPVNSLGYRDREWSPADVSGKLKVMVVGDSVAAGLGINNYQDRFSNKLNDLLGNQAVVFNVASPGWSTMQEAEAVVNYPYKPDILVLAYFINDIEGAAFEHGVERPRFVPLPPLLLQPVVDNSYALNFLYWRLVRWGQQEGQADYLQWVTQTFQNPTVWWAHQQELQTIYDGARAEGIRLIVVVFPNMTSLEPSRQVTGPVLQFFQSHSIETVDVAQLVQGQPVTGLIASPVDAHPNETVHRLVAEQLYRMIQCSTPPCAETK
jgi:hypothetical protein